MQLCGLPMSELYIRKKAVWTEPSLNDSEALATLKSEFPGRSARRMTRLGMQLSHVLRGLEIDESCSLVYATSYSEICAIEKYLDSFPYPSPQGFQTSIHPSAVEQFLIQNKQAITEFFPLAGKEDLLFRALDLALLCQGERIILCGGEERGTWFSEVGVSSESNYAWALELSAQATADSIGCIAWSHLAEAEGETAVIIDFLKALQAEEDYVYDSADGGKMELNWGV